MSYTVIATDHLFPTYVSSVYATREYVSKRYARLGNAERAARELSELFGTVTIVEAAG
jgi:hypothetical protein